MTRLLAVVALGGYTAGCLAGALACRAAWCAVTHETRHPYRP